MAVMAFDPLRRLRGVTTVVEEAESGARKGKAERTAGRWSSGPVRAAASGSRSESSGHRPGRARCAGVPKHQRRDLRAGEGDVPRRQRVYVAAAQTLVGSDAAAPDDADHRLQPSAKAHIADTSGRQCEWAAPGARGRTTLVPLRSNGPFSARSSRPDDRPLSLQRNPCVEEATALPGSGWSGRYRQTSARRSPPRRALVPPAERFRGGGHSCAGTSPESFRPRIAGLLGMGTILGAGSCACPAADQPAPRLTCFIAS